MTSHSYQRPGARFLPLYGTKHQGLLQRKRRTHGERNEVADFLSKEAVQLTRGQWIIRECKNGEFLQVYHRPYIEGGADIRD